MQRFVTFINRCFWPDSEATGQLLTELCEFLAPRWEVSAVVGQPNWDIEDVTFTRIGTQVRNGVAIHRLDHSKLPKRQRFARIRNLVSFTLAVRKWGKTSKLQAISSLPTANLSKASSDSSLQNEIIVCETDPFLLPLVVGKIARRRKAKLIYYLQDIYPDVAVAVGVTKNNLPIQLLRNRLMHEYQKADAIVVLDEDMRDRLIGWGIAGERMHIVPNWMDCSVVHPVKENNPFRHENNLSGKFVVMHSGNMGMTQRLDTLVEAMVFLDSSDANENIQLMLVGNGAKRNELEERVQAQSTAKRISFLDYQPKERLSESLSAADLHVVSMDSAITGCLAPSKLYGILASGTPVLAIVPQGNAVWRIVSENQLGWCVVPGNKQGIADAIIAASKTEPESMRSMGRRARDLAIRLYDKDVCCTSFENILKSVV